MCMIPVLRDETLLYYIGIGMRAAKHLRFGLTCHMSVPDDRTVPYPSIDKVWRPGVGIDDRVRNAAIRGWFNQHVFPKLKEAVACIEDTDADRKDAFCWWVTQPMFIKVKGWNFMEWGVIAM